MKAEELRINNIIYLTKDNFKTVNEYTLTGFDIYKLEDNDCADIKPIPLTEEWLLKFGFEECRGDYYFSNDLLNLGDLEWFNKDRCVKLIFEGTKCGQNIYYIHQLQNIYFALTGEELIIKTK